MAIRYRCRLLLDQSTLYGKKNLDKDQMKRYGVTPGQRVVNGKYLLEIERKEYQRKA